MRAGKISDKELTMAIKMMVSQFRSIEDEPAVMERWYLSRALAGISVSHEEVAEEIERITVRDLSRIAKQITLDTVYFLRGSSEGAEDEEDGADE
jgi:predicted Zn-dependent peptidase